MTKLFQSGLLFLVFLVLCLIGFVNSFPAVVFGVATMLFVTPSRKGLVLWSLGLLILEIVLGLHIGMVLLPLAIVYAGFLFMIRFATLRPLEEGKSLMNVLGLLIVAPVAGTATIILGQLVGRWLYHDTNQISLRALATDHTIMLRFFVEVILIWSFFFILEWLTTPKKSDYA